MTNPIPPAVFLEPEPVPVPEWVADCPHDPICTSESECVALIREDGDDFAHDWAADARWDR